MSEHADGECGFRLVAPLKREMIEVTVAQGLGELTLVLRKEPDGAQEIELLTGIQPWARKVLAKEEIEQLIDILSGGSDAVIFTSGDARFGRIELRRDSEGIIYTWENSRCPDEHPERRMSAFQTELLRTVAVAFLKRSATP